MTPTAEQIMNEIANRIANERLDHAAVGTPEERLACTVAIDTLLELAMWIDERRPKPRSESTNCREL